VETARISILILLLFQLISQGYAQVVTVSDDFEDGEFTSDPRWSGNTDAFRIADEAGNRLLQLDAPEAGRSYLSTASAAAYGRWEMNVRFDFATLSASNNLTIFLISDLADLTGELNGYALIAGESGSDDAFELVRYDGGSVAETVLRGTTNVNSGGDYRVGVDRSPEGRWTLSVASGSDSEPSAEAEGTDNTYATSGYFGIMPAYTSTRSDAFYFDDVVITKSPIRLIKADPLNNRKIRLHFTDRVEPSTVYRSDFYVDGGIGSPDAVTVNGNTVTLSYSMALPGGDYRVTAYGIDDTSGTTLPANSTVPFRLFDLYEEGDIIINEFMYDEPSGLAEYVEIRNTSSKRLELTGWLLGDANDPSPVSGRALEIGPLEYLVIASDTAALSERFGPARYVKMDAFPTLNNGSGDALRLIDSSGETVDSLFYTPDWGGEDVALERRSISTPSVFRENWGDSPAVSGGTPGRANEIAVDSDPPELSELRIANSRTLTLVFSERVDAASAAEPVAYALTMGPDIIGARFSEPDTVRLSLATDLVNGRHYTVTFSGVEDIFGNAAPDTAEGFTYYKISPSGPGDLFINEFMADPPEGLSEYVELYNPGPKSFDLRGWTLNDRTGTRRLITGSPYLLPPGTYLAVAPDSTVFQAFPGIRLLVMGNRFPALNNSGDDIVVRNASGVLLDSLRYRPHWTAEQAALERKSIALAAGYRENWGWSPEPTGTPGLPNAVAPDRTAPELSELKAVDAYTLLLRFSETVESGSAVQTSAYRLAPDIPIQRIAAGRDSVVLHLKQELRSGTTYELAVSGIRDLFGNVLRKAVRKIRFLELAAARAGDIVINEILFRGEPEFVELFNASSGNISLDGWAIGDETATVSLPAGITMEPGSFRVLTGSEPLALSLPTGVYLPGFPALNDDRDAVHLHSDTGVTIDSLSYTGEWSDRDGRSAERRDPKAGSGDPSNWSISSSGQGRTPGARNSEYRPDEHPPEMIYSVAHPDPEPLIEVRFNEFVRLDKETIFVLAGTELNVSRFDPARGDRVFLSQPFARGAHQPSGDMEITAHNLSDLKGNRADAPSIPVSVPPDPGSVVFNEIMYNPLGDPDDNRPDQGEYVELINRSGRAVSLEGFHLHDAPDENGDIRILRPESTLSLWLPAGGILLAYADTAATFLQSRTARYFGLDREEGDRLRAVRFDRSSLGLASSGDALFLADSRGTTVDSVFYDESWQNPNLPDTRGVALERIDPGGPGNVASNWSSSTSPRGGTPGSENSIYQVPSAEPKRLGIAFSPNPFSPDGDGYEDHLFIRYKLDRADYLLKVRIYDRYGRPVRNLADGIPSGFEGTLTWDGLADGGGRNRIGIYIIMFEAFDSSSGARRAFRELVVLARRM